MSKATTTNSGNQGGSSSKGSGSKGGTINPTPPPQPTLFRTVSLILQILIVLGLGFLILQSIGKQKQLDEIGEAGLE